MTAWVLVSVYDKQGIADFCRRLVELGYGILSTGGTAKHLTEEGIPVTAVEEYTGFPEMMDGRVKTLHPRIHGGLLGIRDDAEHVKQMAEHGIDPIDLVVVNLYPFAATIARPNVTFEEAVEMIDIGGPSMLRAAAKNHRFCLPVVDPADYTWIADALAGHGVGQPQRLALATKVYQHTAVYDAQVAAYLTQASRLADGASAAADAAWPAALELSFTSKQSLRYGENPHQRAHFYAETDASPATLAAARQWQGKELSYNNIQDADAALQILRALDDLGQAAVVAVKHMNPCGVGLGATAQAAFQRAYEADPVSIFGGIIACNREVTGALAEQLADIFLEIVIAPSFDEAAFKVLQKKKNLRLLTVDMTQSLWRPEDKVFRRVAGGLLVQDIDRTVNPAWQVVTQRPPNDSERQALALGWRVVQFVKSNAIILNTGQMTLGIGAGQMNRVGAAKIAIEQAAARARGSVLASDAFFPMRDTVDVAAAAGVTAIIQPGGSIKDADSIAAANEHGIAMVFTGERHFLH